MAKSKAGAGRTCAQRAAQATVATERKWKRVAADGEPKKKVVNETTGKWFPSAISSEELAQLESEKSLSADLVRRMPSKEVSPTPDASEHVLHQEFFGRGLGFPLHRFVRGLLFTFGCQLHHLTPNGILHIANFMIFCECFLGTTPHFELFRYFFRVRVLMNDEAVCDLGGASLQLWPTTKFFPVKFPKSVQE